MRAFNWEHENIDEMNQRRLKWVGHIPYFMGQDTKFISDHNSIQTYLQGQHDTTVVLLKLTRWSWNLYGIIMCNDK